MSKKFFVASIAVAASTAMIFGSSPAFALPGPFNDGVPDGDLIVQLRGDDDGADVGHVYYWDGSTESGDHVGHRAGALTLSDGNDDWKAWCDTQTYVETTDNGATNVECDTQTPDNVSSQIFEGITVTPSFRISAQDANGITMARVAFAVSNTTAADITIPSLIAEFDWDIYDYGPTLSNLGVGTVDDVVTGTDMSWINTAAYQDDNVTVDLDTITFGAAWNGANGTAFKSVEGGVSNETIEATETNFVVPAGKTIYFAFYGVYKYISDPAPAGGADAAIALTNDFMAIFDGAYEGELVAGLPADAYVVNWEAAPATPELPNTGAADWTALGAGALALTFVGLALVAIRRRNA